MSDRFATDNAIGVSVDHDQDGVTVTIWETEPIPGSLLYDSYPKTTLKLGPLRAAKLISLLAKHLQGQIESYGPSDVDVEWANELDPDRP